MDLPRKTRRRSTALRFLNLCCARFNQRDQSAGESSAPRSDTSAALTLITQRMLTGRCALSAGPDTSLGEGESLHPEQPRNARGHVRRSGLPVTFHIMKRQVGRALFVGFFGFGACMCILTMVLLLVPGSGLDLVWRLNPNARSIFESLGPLSLVIMAVVGCACAAAAIGLAKNSRWGYQTARLVLLLNAIGDLANSLVRHDPRTLIGLPVAAAMLIYLSALQRYTPPSREQRAKGT